MTKAILSKQLGRRLSMFFLIFARLGISVILGLSSFTPQNRGLVELARRRAHFVGLVGPSGRSPRFEHGEYARGRCRAAGSLTDGVRSLDLEADTRLLGGKMSEAFRGQQPLRSPC